MKRFLALSLLSVLTAACGGSSDGSEERIRVLAPSDMSRLSAGEEFMLRVETFGTALGVPPDRASLEAQGFVGALGRVSVTAAALSHGGVSHEADDGHTDEEPQPEAAEMEALMVDHQNEVAHEELTAIAMMEHSPEEHAQGAEADSHASDEHSHAEGEAEVFNPFAERGHMHVYLDGLSGADPHITTWSYNTPVRLPENLSPGLHSLRLELRDDFHRRVDPESDVILYFEVIADSEPQDLQ